MDRTVRAAWCRLPVCLFAAGRELGKSHLSWSTGKHRWEISLCRISIGKPSSLLLVLVRDELMTLLPLHLPPRTKLKAMGSLAVSLEKPNQNKNNPTTPNLETASDEFSLQC